MQIYIYKIVLWTLLPALFYCHKDSVSTSQFVFEDILWSANWSSDGELVAIGGNRDTLLIFSGKDFTLLQSYPVMKTITKLKWHPLEKLLAIGSQISSEKVSILDCDSGVRIQLDSVADSGARGIDWNYSGEYLAVGDYDGQLSIFTKNGNFVKKLKSDQKAITGLSWHPSKNMVVTVGSHIEIFDLDGGTSQVIRHRPMDVLMLCVEWHKSGDFFVTGDYGDFEKYYPPLLQFWNSNGEKINEIENSTAEYRNMSWSADGTKLATASDILRIWSAEGVLLHKGKSVGLLWGIDWSSDDNQIVTTVENGKVFIWNKEADLIREVIF